MAGEIRDPRCARGARHGRGAPSRLRQRHRVLLFAAEPLCSMSACAACSTHARSTTSVRLCSLHRPESTSCRHTSRPPKMRPRRSSAAARSSSPSARRSTNSLIRCATSCRTASTNCCRRWPTASWWSGTNDWLAGYLQEKGRPLQVAFCPEVVTVTYKSAAHDQDFTVDVGDRARSSSNAGRNRHSTRRSTNRITSPLLR